MSEPSGSDTLADAGEFALIRALRDRFATAEHVVLGPGDDAAVVAVPGGQQAASMDLLVQDRHFRLDWSSAYDVGRKAAACNLSDINAMGGRATSLLVGLGAPPDLPVSWALDFAQGLADECAEVGAAIVGGDVTRADEIVIAVTALGECAHGHVRRGGARPGDVVAHAGRQGWADAGFRVLARGFRSPRLVVEAHRQPEPPYDAGPEAARAGATALIDVSDGLLADTGHIASESGVVIDIHADAMEVPEPVASVGAALGVDARHLVLTGGDDYGLVGCFPPDVELPTGFRPIGVVLAPGDDHAAGAVTVDGRDWEDAGGHEHFT